MDIQNEEQNEKNDELESKKYKDEKIEKESQVTLDENGSDHKIHLITIIGEIEGHENAGNQSKVTKYELLLPQLASIEDSDEIDGVLLLLNTMGGDVEAGLAIAEMVASLSKPTVSLVLGGSHSMVIHPVRMNGMVIGVPQTFNYFREVQNRITGFVCSHCNISKTRYEELMMETEVLTKDVGSVLEGEEAVREGIICEIGGISQAVAKLHELIAAGK